MFYIFYIIKKIDKVSIRNFVPTLSHCHHSPRLLSLLPLPPLPLPPTATTTTTATTSHLDVAGTRCPRHHRSNLTPQRCRNSLSTPLLPLAVSPFLASRRLFLESVSPLASRLSRYASPLSELFGFIFFRFKGSHLTVFLPVASQCIFFCLGSTRAGD
jgi:hypothetical protein